MQAGHFSSSAKTVALKSKKTGMALGIAFSLLLSGCTTYSLEELRQADQKGNAFQQALSELYLNFAENEAEACDWTTTSHFSEKGLRLAYGHEVAPEQPSQWEIPADKLPELNAAREKLLAALTAENRETKPEVAARAMYSYDCWVEQQEEVWQTDDIAACRDGFHEALKELGGTPQKIGPQAEVAAQPAPPLSTSYIIFFGWNSSALDNTAKEVIATVASDLKGEESYEIVLNGHTDTSGVDGYNMDLSQKRAKNVMDALVKQGIAKDKIIIYAYGETRPKVETGDGKKERTNRRVEIFINE